MKVSQILVITFSVMILISCREDEDLSTGALDIPDINEIVTPPDLGSTSSIVELGRMLFWDPILSGNKDVACVTCHHPEFGYADGIELSIGVNAEGLGPERRHLSGEQPGFVKRNAPTIINTAFNGMDEDGNYNPAQAPMFWDNRVQSLEAQALGPIESFEEMRGHAFELTVALDSIVARLQNNAEYNAYFTNVFGNNGVNSNTIGRAIAAFERTIVATNSPFDDFQAGSQNALSQAEIRGMNLFNQVGCADCHSGPMFSDYELHVIGVPDNNAVTVSDAGANGTYAFRTPTLRNLNDTGPYFHNGVGGSLQQTIQFYITARNAANNNGGGPGGPGGAGGLAINPNVNGGDLDEEIRDLRNFNNNDVQDIIAFIRALDDPDFDRTIPVSVPSGLNPGGDIN